MSEAHLHHGTGMPHEGAVTGRADALLGAFAEPGGVRFNVWSDRARSVGVVLYDDTGARSGQLELRPDPADPALFSGFASGLRPLARYNLLLDELEIVDPYARFLPDGVHGPARVSEPLSLRQHPKRRINLEAGEVIYELHVGAFTPEGTFAGAAKRLSELKELGVTVVELMPIAAFAGSRGWGYDGVGLFAPFAPYGTPQDLADLVDCAHGLGLGVVLDVVYNHLGPAGNFLPALSDHYFESERRNAWGQAPSLQKVPFRRFVLQNAQHFLSTFGFDGLRLDAVHELEPGGEPHILEELARFARSLEPPAALLAEDDRNDPLGLLQLGVDGVWSDDFHHAVHTLITRERDGYYRAFGGTVLELARVIERGQLYEGQASPLTNQARGKPTHAVARPRLLYSLQNHDQVGNRAHGERVDVRAGEEAYLAASLLLLFLPSTPLLFMGQEWSSSTPFLFFSDHAGELGHSISLGRRAEFGHFEAFSGAGSEPIPDPQAPETFLRSKLAWAERASPRHARALSLYRRALELRRTDAVLRGQTTLSAGARGALLWVRRQSAAGERLLLWNTADSQQRVPALDVPMHDARLLLGSSLHPPSFRDVLPPLGALVLALDPPLLG